MNTVIKSLVMSLAIGFFSVNAHAGIMGMLAENQDGSGNIKIQSSGGKYDVNIQVDYQGLSSPLEATIRSGFVNQNGDVQFKQSHDGREAFVITLSQNPTMPERPNLDGLSEQDRAQKVQEFQDAMLNSLGTSARSETLSLYKDIIKKNVTTEYRNQIFYAILRGDLPLVLAFQQMKKGAADYSIQYIVINPEVLRSGGTLYQTNAQ